MRGIMSNLDNLEDFKTIDPENFLKSVQEFPYQCETAWEEVKKVVLPSYYVSVNKIVLLGMGGSAIGGDVVKDFINGESTLPMEVIRDYSLPSYVDKETLVVGSSYSGNTEETMEALKEALSRKAKIVIITTDGKILDLAHSYRLPFYQFSYPTEPRQAFGFSFSSVLGILNKLAIIDVNEHDFKTTIEFLKKFYSQIKPDVSSSSNHAKKLAEQLFEKIVIVMGSTKTKALAKRFKSQLNENSKQMAFWEELPEACHNFIVGLEKPSRLWDKVFLLTISSKYDHPRVKLRQNIIFDILNKYKIPCEELGIDNAPNRLAEILGLVYLLDFTSYYLAILNKVNPKEISNIKELKKRLEETPWQK